MAFSKRLIKKYKILSSSCDMCSSKDQPESYCIDCSASMCAFCTRSHRRQIFTSKHEIECLDLQPIYCKTHPDEKVSLFCDNCNTLACRDCAISIHRGHRKGIFCSNIFLYLSFALTLSSQMFEKM